MAIVLADTTEELESGIPVGRCVALLQNADEGYGHSN